MNRLNVITRISICLAFLTVGTLLLADAAGLMPRAADIVRRERTALAESIAVHCSVLASRGDLEQLKAALNVTAGRNQDIASIGVRSKGGRLLVDINNHRARWRREPDERSTKTKMLVPIYAGDRLWGHVEMNFVDTAATTFWGSYDTYLLEMLLFAGVFSYCVFYLFLRRVLQHLDPTRVVPGRVRRALDALTGGLLLLDDQQRIVLANEAFAKTIGVPTEALQGRLAEEFDWTASTADEEPTVLPWQRTLEGDGETRSETISLRTSDDQTRTLMVSSSPILDDGGRQRGAMVSFEDVTMLETKKDELVRMVTALKDSQEAVRKQNEELRRLATRDALTGCLNRRAFFEYFEMQWSASERYGSALSCIMLDIDHFKSINDAHGHAKGDEVLTKVGKTLRQVARESDAVGRYGGEEFCMLATNTELEAAAVFAERCRKAVAAIRLEGIQITVSIGVSSRSLGAESTQELLDESDKALYAAKHGGRNQVRRWDVVAEQEPLVDPEPDQAPLPASKSLETEGRKAKPSIPFHAVNALLSALAYRDFATAAHCTRVADLCAAMSRGRMSVAYAYVLEIAALLHDVGKVGVPDSILLKPGELTPEEWEVMRQHERIGAEIISSSFANPLLTVIVRNHNSHYGGQPSRPRDKKGEEIPLGARILAIADAYDSMVGESVYRTAKSPEDAFAELRRCAGRQFDPHLVEEFIEMMQSASGGPRVAPAHLTRAAALSLGAQVERIAQAVDDLDMEGLALLAARLKSTASKNRMHDVGSIAEKLDDLVREDPDALALVETTRELMDLSRAALGVHVDAKHLPASGETEKMSEPIVPGSSERRSSRLPR